MEKDGMERDIIIMEKKNLKLKMVKEKVKYIIVRVNYYLKVNILMELGMEKEKNIIQMVAHYLKENIIMGKK